MILTRLFRASYRKIILRRKLVTDSDVYEACSSLDKKEIPTFLEDLGGEFLRKIDLSGGYIYKLCNAIEVTSQIEVFLNSLGAKFLRNKLDGHDILVICQLLNDDTAIEKFLNFLGIEFLKSKPELSGYEVSHICETFADRNKAESFLNRIVATFYRVHLDGYYIHKICKIFNNDDKRIAFLKLLGVEVLRKQLQYDFENICMLFESNDKKAEFLKLLGPEFCGREYRLSNSQQRSHSNFFHIITLLILEARGDDRKSIGYFDYLPSSQLNLEVEDPSENFIALFDAEFLRHALSGNDVTKICTTDYYFFKKDTDKEEKFLKDLGADFLKQKLSGDNITRICQRVIKNSKKIEAFLNLFGDECLRQKLSGDHIAKICQRVLKNSTRIETFLKLLGDEYLRQKLSGDNIARICDTLDDDAKIEAFLKRLGVECLRQKLFGQNISDICRQLNNKRNKFLFKMLGIETLKNKLSGDNFEYICSYLTGRHIYPLLSDFSTKKPQKDHQNSDTPSHDENQASNLIKLFGNNFFRTQFSLENCADLIRLHFSREAAHEFVLNTLGIDWFKSQVNHSGVTDNETTIYNISRIFSAIPTESQVSLFEKIDLKELLTNDQIKQLEFYCSCSDLPPTHFLDTFLKKSLDEHHPSSHRYFNRLEHRYAFIKEEFPDLDTKEIQQYSLTGFNYSVFKTLYPITKQAFHDEGNQGATVNAFKLAVLFPSVEEAQAYLKQYKDNNPNSKQPVHDACLFAISRNGLWDVHSWCDFAKKHNYDSEKMKLFANAAEIEAYVNGPLTAARLINPGEQVASRELAEYYHDEIVEAAKRDPYQNPNEKDLWQQSIIILPNDVDAYVNDLENRRTALKNKIRDLQRKLSNPELLENEKTQTEHVLSRNLRELYLNLLPSELGSSASVPEKSDAVAIIKTYEESLKSDSVTRPDAVTIIKTYEERLKNDSVTREEKKHIREEKLPSLLRELFSEQQLASLPSATDIKSADETKKVEFLAQIKFKKFLSLVVHRRLLQHLSDKEIHVLSVERVIGEFEEAYQEEAYKLIQAGLSRASILKALDLHKHHLKQQDYIPDLTIDGAAIGFPGYYMEKIPQDDLSIFIAGKETSCCQHLDGHSKDCVVHSAISPYGGVYRIMKREPSGKKKWVAQSWVGLTPDNELVMDSIERNQGYDTQMIMQFYAAAATEILSHYPHIARVLFGGGGQTPNNHGFPLFPLSGKNYSHIIGYWKTGYDSQGQRYVLAEQQKNSDKNLANDFILANGVDTYNQPGKAVKTVARNPFARNRFFKAHPLAHAMLMQIEKNPLIEEGYYAQLGSENTQPRQRFGELGFTHEALRLLLDKKIVTKAKSDSSYQVDNFIITDSKQDLIKLLQSIKLQKGQNILVAYNNAIHSQSAYIQNVNGCIKVFANDPESPLEPNSDLCQAIQKTFTHPKIIRMTAKLQIDQDCSIFLIKALMFYAKHGKTLFAEIDKPENLEQNGLFYDLQPAKTPARLLKMAHSEVISTAQSSIRKFNIQVAPTVLQQRVSGKNPRTLVAYLAEYRRDLNRDGKMYSVATIAKKYKYLDELEQIIENQTMLTKPPAV